jgi:hypothetical protein
VRKMSDGVNESELARVFEVFQSASEDDDMGFMACRFG